MLIASMVVACNFTPSNVTAPASASAQATPTPYIISDIPTPSANQCAITGVLLQNPGPKPVTRQLLALANILTSQGTPAFARFNSQNAIRTMTDDKGRFFFRDIPCDDYALIFDKITETFMLTQPNTGEDLIFSPEAGQLLDLGNLVYSDLPIPTPIK